MQRCRPPGLRQGRHSTLNENGHRELVRHAVAVVNAVREEGLVEVGKVEHHFAGRCRAVIQLPWDPDLSAGAKTQIDRLRPATRRTYLEVAAAVAPVSMAAIQRGASPAGTDEGAKRWTCTD
jgi:hypothetical protein